MPLLEQIVLRRYLRTPQADYDRVSRELNAANRKRRVCPFVEELRWRRLQNARELREVGEECLDELRHASALSIADFFPGYQVTWKS
jgi:hypothetical protein